MKIRVSLEHWQAEAITLFGQDPNHWKFQCPICQQAQSMADFHALGMNPKQALHIVGYSCIRRWTDQLCMSSGAGPVELQIADDEIRPTFHWAS